jgi:urea transport system ATP-binding protein
VSSKFIWGGESENAKMFAKNAEVRSYRDPASVKFQWPVKNDAMLSIENIDLFYGRAQALRGVSLEAEFGKVTTVLGRNGVGKTSLLRALTGHVPVSKGRITWDGQDITTASPSDRARAGIAYVPQGREIFPLLTVRENLETGFAMLPRAQRKLPPELFELFPVLQTMLGRRGGDLSGGQQQQLAIARALVMRPRLLVLDEPTEGIQPSIIKDIGRTITYLRNQGNMAIVLVEQYFDFARELADTFAVLDRGEVVLAGKIADVPAENIRRHLTV